MSVDDAKRLYEAIAEDQDLQAEFEGLETREDVLAKWLEIADREGINADQSDVEALVEELAEDPDQLDQEQLEEVAGGRSTGDGNPGNRCKYSLLTER